MKRLLLSAAVVAMAGPAWGQVQADYQKEIDERYWEIVAMNNQAAENGEDVIYTYNPPSFTSDIVIVANDRVGSTNTRHLTVPAFIVSGADIRNRNQGVVADLLRTVPGLAVSQNGGAGSLTQIRLRGAEANQIVVIIDGVEVANPADGAFDFGGLRNEDIVKIEVLRGEQSALYGSDAIGGVINIITRAGNTAQNWRASVEGGSRDTVEGQISAIIPLGGAALSLNGNAFNTDGFDISGLGGEKDGSSFESLNLGLNNVELGGITFSGKFGISTRETDFDSDTNIETNTNIGFDGSLDNTDESSEVHRESARVDARFNLANFDHKITATHTQTDTDTAGGFASRSIGTRRNLNWAAKRDFGDLHSFTALTEVETETYEIDPNFTEPDAEPENTNYGVAGDYRFTGDELTLTASARHDFNDLFDDSTTWRVGAGYGFSWKGRLRASAGTGVKNPTLIELFGFFPASRFVGNQDLRPETSLGVSIGYEQAIGNLNVSVDVFRSELEDEITTLFNPDFTTTVVNLGTDSTRQGLELAASWSTNDVTISSSASLLDSEENDINEIRRPNFLASLTTTWQPLESLSLTASLDHTGSQIDSRFFFDPDLPDPNTGNLGSFTSEAVDLDAFTLVGANARFNVSNTVALTLRGSNLLDDSYEEIFSFASPGRAVFGGLELDF